MLLLLLLQQEFFNLSSHTSLKRQVAARARVESRRGESHTTVAKVYINSLQIRPPFGCLKIAFWFVFRIWSDTQHVSCTRLRLESHIFLIYIQVFVLHFCNYLFCKFNCQIMMTALLLLLQQLLVSWLTACATNLRYQYLIFFRLGLVYLSQCVHNLLSVAIPIRNVKKRYVVIKKRYVSDK